MKIKLNLIPPEKKKEIEKNTFLKLIIRLEIFLAMALLIFVATLLGFSYVLNFELESCALEKNGPNKKSQYEKLENYDKQFAQINSKISKIKIIEKDQLYWSVFFDKMNEVIFPGIDVDSIYNSDYTLVLAGKAFTREDLILFKEKIENEECFEGVNLPLSNLVGRSNIEFQIDFNIKKNCLKK